MRGVALIAVAAVLAAACGSGAAAPSPTRLATAPVIRTAAPTQSAGCVVKAVTFTKAPSKATITLERGGTIVIALRSDKAPKTVQNFANVANSGCYDGLVFHRVVASFVIQGGDPLGTGTGGGQMPAEYNDLPFVTGSVGIARGGDRTINNDRQFFICTSPGQACGSLTGDYTNFGQVTSGQDIADKVVVGDKIKTIRVE